MTKLSEIRVGDLLKVDDGFSCVPPNSLVTVYRCKRGLYFECTEGRHYLDGQTNENGNLVGLEKT